jgi:hypothetical protein
MAKEIAESFIRRFSGPAPPLLKVTFIEPGSGCQGPTAYFEKEIRLLELSAELALRAALDRLAAAVAARPGLRMLPAEARDPLEITVEMPRPRDDAELERTAEFVRTKARENVSAGVSRPAKIQLRLAGDRPEVLKEETLETRSRKRPPPPPVRRGGTSPSGPTAAPAGSPGSGSPATSR